MIHGITILLAILYLAIAILTFGHASNVLKREMRTDPYFADWNSNKRTDRAIAGGAFAAIAWPLYWSDRAFADPSTNLQPLTEKP